MSNEKAATRKVPLWVWIVGGFLVVGLFGNLLGGEDQEINADEAESALVEVTPVDSEIVEEAGPEEAEVLEEQSQTAKTDVVEEEAMPAPEPSPAPESETEPAPVPSSETTDPRFSSCTKAIDAGFGPYTQGIDVEYGWYQDRDNDGIVCER